VKMPVPIMLEMTKAVAPVKVSSRRRLSAIGPLRQEISRLCGSLPSSSAGA
jgi:hypothetical protein